MKSKGFTLIEVLLAVGILGIIFSMIYWTFSRTYDVIDAFQAEMESYRSVRLTLDKISQELSSAYWRNDSKDSLFIGEDLEHDGKPNDSLRFMSASNYGFSAGSNESDMNIINYYLEKETDKDTYKLIHSEKTNLLSISDNTLEVYELGESITGFNIRYFDGNDWFNSWNSDALKAIPMAVEIKLIIKDNNGREKTFTAITEIPMGKTIKRP